VARKLPSPCVDVCKFRNDGHCIACAMTKAQKKLFKSLDGARDRAAFLQMLLAQQQIVGFKSGWIKAYRRKCAKKGVDAPL
jgi:hypothetical protein